MEGVMPASFFVYAAHAWNVKVSSLWMLASYLIGYVSLILPAFRVSELTGRLSTFWFGLILFVIFTGVSGHAHTSYAFAVLRAFQGAGAGIITSVSVLLVATNTSDRNRALAVGGLCAAQLFGVGAAHIIGGKLAVDDRFRWGIYLAAPLAALPAILCTPALIADKKPPRDEPIVRRVVRFDYIGTLILIGTVIMETMGLTFGGNEHKWDTAIVICLIVFGAVGIAAFLLWEKFGASRPIFNTRWLHERNLQISIISILLMSMVFFSLAVYVPILYITARTEPTDVAGRKAAPYWGMSMAAAVLVGAVLRFKPALARPLAWLGLVISIIFTGLYYNIPLLADTSKERGYYAMAGLGMGLAYPAVAYIAQASVPLEEVGAAAVVSHFLSVVGGMLGLILYQACLKSRLIHNLSPIFKSNALLQTFHISTMDIAALEASGPSLLNYVPTMTEKIGTQMVDALHTTFVISVPFLGAALLATLFYKLHGMRS
ncbi:major facilitator superfamily-domain-containing protein [Coemansia spiralis]|nr:major facilitator superfamily-domain-containing protein [Coemansia spiralis]